MQRIENNKLNRRQNGMDINLCHLIPHTSYSSAYNNIYLVWAGGERVNMNASGRMHFQLRLCEMHKNTHTHNTLEGNDRTGVTCAQSNSSLVFVFFFLLVSKAHFV